MFENIKIVVKALKFKTIIGLLDFERTTEQFVEISLKFGSSEFMDYAQICKELEEIFNKNQFFTIEEALEFCLSHFKAKFPTLSYFYMEILKPDILQNAVVGCELEKFY